MTKPRGGTLTFFAAVGLAAGGAFAAGSHLRAHLPDHLRRQSMQLAQARPDGTGLSRPGAADPFDDGGSPRRRSKATDEGGGFTPLDTFLYVFDVVRKTYVDELPEERKMAQGAVRAMLAGLNDPNSRFLEPADRKALDAEADGRFAGIGAAFAVLGQKRDGYTEFKITVVAPLPGSPAQKAGLKTGDVVTHVDGKWVIGSDPFLQASKIFKRVQAREATEEELEKAYEAAQERVKSGITLSAAQKKLTLGEGEKRLVAVQRPGVAAPLKFEVMTALTKVEPVTTRTLPGGSTYIRVAAFTEQAGAGFKQALADLPEGTGLVLDLRGNPGGLLEPVKEMASALTRGGDLLVEEGPGGKRKTLSLPAAGRGAPRPVVILVDKGTASSAEALAVVLRDKKVGVLLGAKTFGDAMVQTLYPLADGSAYTLTTGKLLSPGGDGWHGVGLAPGIALAAGTPEEQVMAKAVAVLKDRAHVAAAALPQR